MASLPTPGGDQGTWGTILNAFLEVAHNSNGTLKTSAVLAAGAGTYSKPASGIPSTDLSSSVQSNLSLASSSVQLGGDLGGTTTVPTIAKLQGTTLNTASPANNQVLSYSSSGNEWVPATVSNTPVNDATSSTPGIIQLDGDLGNTATSPQVVSTHLSSPLPIAQGGTNSTTQNFVDLSSNQTIAGTKTFSTTITGSISGNAATVTTNANLTGDVTSVGNATTLAKIQGVTTPVSAPSTGQVLTATSSSASAWSTPSNVPVASVFGRTGAITAQTGDYTATQVGALPGTDDLSAIATANPTTAAWSNNAKKITNIANGSAASDAAAFGQIPSSASGLGAAQALNPTSVQTASYSASANDFAKFDISGGSITQSLPQAPADKSLFAAKIINTNTSGTNTLTLDAQGSDVINKASGATTYILKLLNQTVLMQYQVPGAIWNVVDDDLPLTQLDNRYGELLMPSGDASGATDAAAVNTAVSAGYQLITLGPGQWYFGTNRISLTAGPAIKIVGSGAVLNDQGGTNATVINAGSSSSATGVFFFSHTSSLISGTEIGNLDIVYAGTGNVFDDFNLQSGYFHDLNITLGSQGSACAFFTGPSETANNSVINVSIERCIITSTASTRTVPMISFTSENSGGISDLTITKCKFNNTGQDTSQPAIYVACSATGSGYHYATTLRDCYFEKPLGGAIKSLSGSGLLVDHCMFWDMSGLTVGNSTVYAGAYSGNIGSQGVKVSGCGRNRFGPNGSSTWDVECESTTSQVIVEGFHILANSQSTQTNAFFNFHDCNDVILLGNVSPQGSAVNGNSTTVVTNPAANQFSVQNGALAVDGTITATSAVLSGATPLQITQGASSGKVLTSDSSGNATWQTASGGGGGSGGSGLTDTAVKTGAYTALAGDMVLVDTSTPGAQVTITTPASPAANALFGVKLVKQSGTFGITVQANSGVTFNDDSSTSIFVSLLNQSAVFQYDSSLSAWIKYYGDTPLSGLDSTFLALPSGTATAGYVPTATGSGTTTTWSSVTGATGPAGPTGLNWRGTYSNTTTYAQNDAVYYSGSSFIATAGTTGVNPGTPSSPNTNWNALSSEGATGPSGSGLAGVTTASDQGYLGWSATPIMASGSASQSTGQIWGSKINLPSGTTTGIAMYVNTAATGTSPILTQGESYIGLINSSGSLVAYTADCSGQTFTVGTTATSATVSGTGFAATMVGGQYTIAGVSGTFTVATVTSSTSLTMTATIPTTVSSATMTPTANFSWLSPGIKYTPWVTSYSLSAGDYYVGVLTVLGSGSALPKFQSAPTGLPTTLIGSAAPTATGIYAYPMSGQLGGLSSQTSIPASMTLSSTAAVNTTYWLAVY